MSVRFAEKHLSPPLMMLLLIAVVLRLAIQAFFVPAYEGPDEPFHLARIAAFADRPLGSAFVGETIDGTIIAGMLARPCGPTVHQYLGCRLFGSEPASFNLLRPLPRLPPIRNDPNPESNQPPLFYLIVALLREPRRCRTLLASQTKIAVNRPRRLAVAGLLLLLLPGASEALARCSNDASVFLWSAAAILALERKLPSGGHGLPARRGTTP